MALLESNCLPKASPPNTTTLGIRVSTYGFGETQTFSPQQLHVFKDLQRRSDKSTPSLIHTYSETIFLSEKTVLRSTSCYKIPTIFIFFKWKKLNSLIPSNGLYKLSKNNLMKGKSESHLRSHGPETTLINLVNRHLSRCTHLYVPICVHRHKMCALDVVFTLFHTDFSTQNLSSSPNTGARHRGCHSNPWPICEAICLNTCLSIGQHLCCFLLGWAALQAPLHSFDALLRRRAWTWKRLRSHFTLCPQRSYSHVYSHQPHGGCTFPLTQVSCRFTNLCNLYQSDHWKPL